MQIVVQGPAYFSQNDEAAMFEWLAKIEGVSVGGEGSTMRFTLKRRPSQTALRELLGLFYRYRLDMRPLAIFRQPTNEHWFAAPDAYWHRAVFGTE